MDELRTIGERIKYVCTALKISQNAMAKELSMSSGNFSDLVTGKRLPSDRFYKDIKFFYGISTEWLKFGTGDMFIYGKYTDREAQIVKMYMSLNKEEQEVAMILLEGLTALLEKRRRENAEQGHTDEAEES